MSEGPPRDAPDLRGALRRLDPHNPVVDAMRSGAGASAAVAADVRPVERSGAIEVRTRLRGPGSARAAVLDVTITADDLLLHSMRGGRFETAYPPAAYAPVARSIHPHLPFPWATTAAAIRLGSTEGRSSDGDLPFFLLGDAHDDAGIWIGVAWTGSWEATLTKMHGRDEHRLVVTAAGCDLDLVDGEDIELPRVIVGAYRGNGWAAVRRFIATERPRPSSPWVVYNTFFNENIGIDEAVLLANAEVAAEVGVEVFTIDAGWYHSPAAPWNEFETDGIGTWEVDAEKFPRGLEPVAAAVHEHGMRFGIWFDPERAHPDSRVAREHPEWLLHADGETCALLDLGRGEVQEWIVAMLSAHIARLGVDWIKWDMNTRDPRPHWKDARIELAYIRGLYTIWDALRARHPDLLLEACAGGGNRVDLEMLSRADSYWISDQTINPDMVRDTVANALAVLPAQYCYLSLAPQVQPRSRYPDDWFHGVMSGVMGFMEPLRRWPPSLRQQAAEHIACFKSIRHLLDGDVTRFCDAASNPLARWVAWEVADQSSGDAVLFAFRQQSPDARRTFHGARSWQVDLPERGSVVLSVPS